MGHPDLHTTVLDLAPIRAEFDLPADYPADAVADAMAAADSPHAQASDAERLDLSELAFVTIDPAGSMDLDQAMHIDALDDGGWRVRYAIADVGALITPGSALEAESLRRGQTIYLPGEPIRLHPAELSEDSGSLLPEQRRRAVVWDITVAADGTIATYRLDRAWVRSVARFDYVGTEADRRAGTLHPSIAALPELAAARRSTPERRRALNLRTPDIRVSADADGDSTTLTLLIEPRTAMSDDNAEVSVLAGMCAARIMLEGGVGVLRTLPEPDAGTVAEFDAAARALGCERGARSMGEFLDSVDANTPQGMALMRDARRVLRGAGYRVFGVGEGDDAGVGKDVGHAGIGGAYAHVTAPLRRLVDRYGTEVCLALTQGREVPEWVSQRLPEVVERMRTSGRQAGAVDRACIDYAEAAILEGLVGQELEAIVLHSEAGAESADVFIPSPPVMTSCAPGSAGTLPPEGQRIRVLVRGADRAERRVDVQWADSRAVV